MAVLSRVLLLASGVNGFLMKSMSDPMCRNGIRSVPAAPGDITVCCPAYCGRCNDYATCKEVNGQASEDACCASKVVELSCENNASDPYCLKSCAEKSAPCSLGKVPEPAIPETTSAAEDCGNTRKEYYDELKDSVHGVKNGEQQWEDMQPYVTKIEAEMGVGVAQEAAENAAKMQKVMIEATKTIQSVITSTPEFADSEQMQGEVKDMQEQVEEVAEEAKDMEAQAEGAVEAQQELDGALKGTAPEPQEIRNNPEERKHWLKKLALGLKDKADAARRKIEADKAAAKAAFEKAADDARKVKELAEQKARELAAAAKRKAQEAAAEVARRAQEAKNKLEAAARAAAEATRRAAEEAAARAREAAARIANAARNLFRWR